MLTRRFVLALAFTKLGAALPAQVTMDAFAQHKVVVWASAGSGPQQRSWPAGHRFQNGSRLSVQTEGQGGLLRASASISVDWQASAQSIVANARLGASATGNVFGQASANFGGHGISLRFRSPVSARATLRVGCCGRAGSSGSGQGYAEVDGRTVLTADFSSFCLAPNQRADVPVSIGPAGVLVVLNGDGGGVGTARGSGGAGLQWRVELIPDPDFPCRVTTFGTPCGATLAATPDLRYPGMHRLSLTDPSDPTHAWLAVGTTRVTTRFFGCELLTDTVFYAPWAIDSGVATMLIEPPPVPGARALFQAATLAANGAVHLTEGVELTCR